LGNQKSNLSFCNIHRFRECWRSNLWLNWTTSDLTFLCQLLSDQWIIWVLLLLYLVVRILLWLVNLLSNALCFLIMLFGNANMFPNERKQHNQFCHRLATIKIYHLGCMLTPLKEYIRYPLYVSGPLEKSLWWTDREIILKRTSRFIGCFFFLFKNVVLA